MCVRKKKKSSKLQMEKYEIEKKGKNIEIDKKIQGDL